MNKKILTLLAIFVVAVSLTTVCAVELTKENDFDSLFKMKISESDNFVKIGEPNSYSSLLKSGVTYKNDNDTIFVLYFDDYGINQCIEIMSDAKFNNDDLVKEGDLTLFNATPEMENYMDNYTITTFAGITGETDGHDSTVIIGGTNETLVKEYADTIEFMG